jgi:hypothetical protein
MSPVLGQIYAPFSFRGSPWPDTKIKKFDTKTMKSRETIPLNLYVNFILYFSRVGAGASGAGVATKIIILMLK